MSAPAGYVQLPSGFWVAPDGSGPYFVDVATGATQIVGGVASYTAAEFAALPLATRQSMAGATIIDPATGAVLGVVDGAGNLSRTEQTEPIRRWTELLSTSNAALWDDRSGAGMTVNVDPAVLFDGKPTLRLDIPAGSSGTYRVGTSAATVYPPYLWDGKQMAAAVMSSNLTAVSSSSIFLGDAAFANFYSFGGMSNVANVPEANWVANEWMTWRYTTSAVGGGAPTFVGAKRLRFNITVTSVGTATSVWIGFCGITFPKVSALIMSIDDGYASGYSFVAPLARYYKIPVSFGIDSALVGTNNYMTAAQIQELQSDTSNLFEFVTHGFNNQTVTGRDAAYVEDQVATRAYLRGLGISGSGPNHHPWVQSLQTDIAIAGLKAAGFLSARIGGSTPKSLHDALFSSLQDKRVYQMINAVSVTTGISLAAAQTAITTAITTENYGVTHVNGHDFAAADAASPPTWSYDKMIDLMGWIAAQRTAGLCEPITWGRWYSKLVGAVYVK